MEALLVSTGVVALAEIGDKTQLLAFMLAARYAKPWPIVAGIAAATIANHTLAGALGAWIGAMIDPEILRWLLGLSFVGMAIWTLIPDKMDDRGIVSASGLGVFGVTLTAFFLAEMGDKTQLATIALAAKYAAPVTVIMGTTLGMLIADVPAVFIAQKLADRLPARLFRVVAAALFALLGIGTIAGLGKSVGL